MIGFIKKDVAMIKSNFKLLGILIVVYTIMGLYGKMDISFILPFMSVVIMISTFSYDNFNKWEEYASTLPDGRRCCVKSKYITTLLMILITSIIVIILSFIISYINTKTINYEQTFVSMLGTVFGTLLVLSFMYPVIYKFGVEKARIGIFITVFGIVIIGDLLVKYINFTNIMKILNNMNEYILILLLILSCIIFIYVSYRISLKIHLHKEL